MGPLLFFFAWNIIRIAFLWYTQEFGYTVGTSITKDLSGGLMGKITEGASILGMLDVYKRQGRGRRGRSSRRPLPPPRTRSRTRS